jgi:hypothetical protein
MYGYMYDVKFCISWMGGSYFTFSATGFGVSRRAWEASVGDLYGQVGIWEY